MTKSIPTGQVRGQPRRDFILEISLKEAGSGEGGERWGPAMLELRVAGSRLHLLPGWPPGCTGTSEAEDTHPRCARVAAADPARAGRRRAQAGCRVLANAAPHSWWWRPLVVRDRRVSGSRGCWSRCRRCCGSRSRSAGTCEHPGVSVAPPRRLQSGSAFAPGTWEPWCQKGLRPGRGRGGGPGLGGRAVGTLEGRTVATQGPKS